MSAFGGKADNGHPISPEGQKTTANYKINGEQLFYPNANDHSA
jgi:ABC-type tungstate transport system permease subunit